MTQNERCLWLINYLLDEKHKSDNITIPGDYESLFNLYRSLVNVRMPSLASEQYLQIEDEFLQTILRDKVKDLSELSPVSDDIYIWQGDICTLKVDAIVNAANSEMLGCFVPCHTCIDNCIHTFAGTRLRYECNELMKQQGYSEPTGKAKITPAYNLPSSYVIHTVGPIVSGPLQEKDKSLLASCYSECLKCADEHNLESIAFCCISTGVFGFPNKEAAETAVKAVSEYKEKTGSKIKIVFNVFKNLDKELYADLFSKN